MSDEESITVDTSEAQLLTAEYRDGQLQIVEVTPFDKPKETHILPDQIEKDGKFTMVETDKGGKFTMVETDKGLVQLDLLNLRLVRCEDGDESYRIMSGEGSEDDGDGTVTCVLQSSESDNQDNQDSYVMMENDQGSLVLLQPSQAQNRVHTVPPKPTPPKIVKKPVTPAELLEKTRAIHKAKSLMSQIQPPRMGKRGRKRKSDLPPPHELLASPNFKLYLYSCKLCSFKCNAIKDLTTHKVSAHGPGGRLRGMRGVAGLQCARCPYKAATPSILEKHVITHEAKANYKVTRERLTLDQIEVADADVLVCGACGFESPSRQDFKRHIETSHQPRGSGS